MAIGWDLVGLPVVESKRDGVVDAERDKFGNVEVKRRVAADCMRADVAAVDPKVRQLFRSLELEKHPLAGPRLDWQSATIPAHVAMIGLLGLVVFGVVEHGDPESQKHELGLDPDGIAAAVRDLLVR